VARQASSDLLAALAAGTVRIVGFFEGRFTGGTINLWTGIGPISWNGKTWQGAGNLIGVSQIEETSDIKAVGVTFSLAGIPGAMISLVLQSVRQGDPMDCWIAALDLSTGAVICDPDNDLLFNGRTDVPVIDEDGQTATISITAENRLIDLERARERRYTPEDQHIDYPGDKGFDYVVSLQSQDIIWGRS
jgi:hypothetical protein